MFWWNTAELALELAEIFLIGYVFFEIDIRIEKLWNIGIIFFIYLAAVRLKLISKDDNPIAINVVVIIVLWIIMSGTGIEKFKNILKIDFMAALLEFIANAFVRLFCDNGLEKEKIFIISNIALIFIMIAVRWMKIKYLAGNKEGMEIVSEKAIYICAIIMGISLFLTVSGLEVAEEYVPKPRFSQFIKILIIVLLFSILLLILFLQYVNNMNRKIKEYLEIERLLKESQKNYYEAMLQKEEETKRFRHDMMNHLICLRELAKSQEKRAVTDYIENLQSGISEIQHKRYNVGNLVIDAIMNYYMQMLEDPVDVMVIGKCPEEIGITQMELCTIFSNVMQNAVEGLRRQKKGNKYLKVNISAKIENVKIEIINSTEQKNEKRKGILPETIKDDQDHHGFGMRNVKETVERNGGEFQWRQFETEFWIVVFLPCRID